MGRFRRNAGIVTLASSMPVNREAADEVVKAYYPAIVSAGDAARTRAQTAYTIASAVATAIVAAGIFGDIAQRPTFVKVLGALALAAWLLTAGLFMHAVAGRIDPVVDGEQLDVSAFVRAVITNARHERRVVVRRSATAMLAGSAAMALTLAAVVLAWLLPAPTEHVHGRVALSPAGAVQVQRLCGTRPDGGIGGWYDPSKLADDVVAIDVDADDCGGSRRTLRLPGSMIRGALADAR